MLKRIAANVITRLAVIAILAALAFVFGTSKAHAQDCGSTADACDAGQAIAACQAAIPPAADPPQSCSRLTGSTDTSGQYVRGFSGIQLAYYHYTSGCATRSNEYTWAPPGPSGAYCYDGCKYDGVLDSETLERWAAPSGDTCSVGEFEAPSIDSDGDGEPDETDAFPNDPAETADSDGDGIGDNADFSPDDATDGEDTPGEEDGDDEGDNQASGGGTCAAAPSCKGDGIACAQLFQLWRMRCQSTAQGKVTGNPQDCTQTLIVESPDPVANAQLLALRKIACTQGDGGNGNAQGDANGNGVADVLEGDGSPGEDNGEDPAPTRFGLGINTDLLDKENIFGGGQCPTMPAFQIYTASINPAEYSWWCDFLAIARVMIPLLAGWAALQILMGRYF